MTRVDGDKVLLYRSQLVQILQLTLHLKCKQGYSQACKLLYHILRAVSIIYPKEYCSVPGGFQRHTDKYLPIKVRVENEAADLATDSCIRMKLKIMPYCHLVIYGRNA